MSLSKSENTEIIDPIQETPPPIITTSTDSVDGIEIEKFCAGDDGIVQYTRVERILVDDQNVDILNDEMPINFENMGHFDFGVGRGDEFATVALMSTPEAIPICLKDERSMNSENERELSDVPSLEKRLRELENEKGLIILSLRNLEQKQKEPSAERHTVSKSSNVEVESLHGESQTQSESIMSQSMCSEESALSDDRFVKVKICEIEDSSKGSSQSGTENLESEEQISHLTIECKKLRSTLKESQEQYLKVKLELESHLLEAQTQCDAETKSSQEIQRLKEALTERDDELVDLRILIEEAIVQDNDENTTDKKLTDMLSLLISSFKKKSPLELAPSQEDENLKQKPEELFKLKDDLISQNRALENLSKAYSEREAEVDKLNAEIQELRDNETNIIGGYQAVSAELVNLQQTCAGLSTQLQFTQDELSVKTEVSKEELDRLKEELLAKDEDMLEIQTCMDELRITFEDKINELKTLNEMFEVHKAEFSVEKTKSDSANQNQQEQIQILQGTLKVKDTELDNAKIKIEKFKKVVFNLKRQCSTGTNIDSKDSTPSPSPSVEFEVSAQHIHESQILDLRCENQKLIDELLSISEEKQKLEIQIKSMTSEIQQLEQSADRSSQQVDELEKVLDEKNLEIEKLVHSIDSKTEELTSCANLKGEEMQNTIQEYHMMLENSASHERQLKDLLDEKLLHMEEILAENENVNACVVELENRLMENDKLIKSMETDRNKYLDEIRISHANITHIKEREGQLTEIVEAKSRRIDQIETLNSELIIQIEQLTAQVLSKSHEIAELINSLEGKDIEIKKLTVLKDTLQHECDELHELVLKLEIHQTEMKSNLATMKTSIEFDLIKTERDHMQDVKVELGKIIQDKTNEIIRLEKSEDELNQIRIQKNILQNQLLETQNRVNQIEAEFQRKSEEVEVLREMEVLAVKNELAILKAENEELQTKILRKHDFSLRLESENANLRNEIQIQEIALAETRERASFFETEIRSVTHSTAHLETDINHLRETVIGLETQLSYANTQIQSFKERIERDSILSYDKVTTSSVVNTSTLDSSMNIDVVRDTERKEKELLEKKIELLQSKISEIEVSEIKSFEECLMLKGWVRQLEMENLKYQDHLKALQSTKDGDLNSAKAKTLQDEVIRLVHTLQERDNRCGHLTTEITRLLEERDGLQLKLSNVLKRNVSLINDNQLNQDSYNAPSFDNDSVQSKINELENLNYAINIDLRREKEARRLVQEQLLLSQNSRFYLGRGVDPTRNSGHQSYSPTLPQKYPKVDSTNILKPTSPSSTPGQPGQDSAQSQGSFSSKLEETSKPTIVHI